ncbi:integrase [Quadrisphaera granulorum]|uniref:Integrase n=1 Tax=Quadrisphaera granulorum TaxID=317664 RepID=A0A315ZRV2_9ACTN|nr:tyrosine-type recombinase/integrase [Quadrisphaera granulorum]PWJ47608.1 integrase [Quadrisphaera granulorum]SZE98738.1 integrase [Quadrisphaera granulorum]
MARRSTTPTTTPRTATRPSARAARAPRAASTGRSANGSGSVVARQRAHDTVYDVFWTYYDDDGVRRRGSARGFATAKEAEKHRRSVTATVDSGRYVPPAQMTVGQYLAEWIEGQRLKPATISGYRRKIRLHIEPHLGRLPLDQLRPLQLNKLYRHLEARGRANGGPLSMSTVREVHNILSSALTDAVKAGLLADSPTRRADPPTERECKARRPEMTVWTASQLRRFLKANRGDHYYSIWHVLAATGLRRGEVLGLKWSDIDLEHGVMSVRRSLGYADTPIGQPKQLVFGPVKNHGSHVIHIDPETVRVLREHRAAQDADRAALGERWVDQDLVFARGTLWLRAGACAGSPLDPERISMSFKVALTRADVPPLRLHDLRHTWATLALGADVHPKIVQERLNHSSISITLDIYSHVVRGMDADAAATVANLFADDADDDSAEGGEDSSADVDAGTAPTPGGVAAAASAEAVRPRSLRRRSATS